MTTSFHDGRVTLHHGDCLAVLDTLPDNSVDACVCDPPYHLHSIVKRFGKNGATPAKHGTDGAYARASRGFMSKTWDGGDIAFQPETWAKVLRVLKPGAYIVAFSSSRTFGRMSVALEDAGFITHPMIGWVTGQGFPKATRVKAPGYEGQRYGAQALKPALEPIYVGQKPFSEENGTANILRWGTGAINVDACRVESGSPRPSIVSSPKNGLLSGAFREGSYQAGNTTLGRWPPNLLHNGSDEVVACFPNARSAGVYGNEKNVSEGMFGKRTGGSTFSDSGSAARFFPAFPLTEADRIFYHPKAGKADRAGSRHPTVKPIKLMRWLCRLVTPPGGLILDPFAGSGTTGRAALDESMRAVLIEREADYIADIERRMTLVYAGRDERARKIAKRDDAPLPLFWGGR